MMSDHVARSMSCWFHRVARNFVKLDHLELDLFVHTDATTAPVVCHDLCTRNPPAHEKDMAPHVVVRLVDERVRAVRAVEAGYVDEIIGNAWLEHLRGSGERQRPENLGSHQPYKLETRTRNRQIRRAVGGRGWLVFSTENMSK